AREYTREAGVRGLERRIGDVCRKAAVQVARGSEEPIDVTEELAREWLGPRRFSAETRRRTADPGVATGLAYTPVGGDVLYIEAQAYAGRGRLTVTGQLGEVMQESAQAALSWVRSHTEELDLDERWFSRHDVHLHVPAGAVPKDGPSAGIAMATAIASLVRETPVADDVAMTGEITLTGQVLPIGGVRDKVLAAQRAGLGRVILPRENEHDLEELPPETRDALSFVLVDSIDEVFDAAFQLAGDKDLQDEIRSAIDEIRNASGRVKNVKRGAPEPARAAKNSMLLLIGIALGLLLNPITGPALRRLLARKLFGSGHGFVDQGHGTKTPSE